LSSGSFGFPLSRPSQKAEQSAGRAGLDLRTQSGSGCSEKPNDPPKRAGPDSEK
jgi:hypothetical protein